MAVVTTCSAGALWWRYLRRLPNTDYLTPAVIRSRSRIGGTVVRVGDGDGFRLVRGASYTNL